MVKEEAKKKLFFFTVGVSCLFTLEGLAILMWNLFSNTAVAIVFNIYSWALVWLLVMKQVVAVLVPVIVNLIWWRLKGLYTPGTCPEKRFLYWEWVFAAVLIPELPKLLVWFGLCPAAVGPLLWVTHHLVFGAIFAVSLAMFFNYAARNFPKLEARLMKWELLPEIKAERVVILSIAVGFYIGWILDALLLGIIWV